MSSGRIPSVEGGIQPTIVDAKGDLIVATAADTVSRLAVGTNDYVLTADSSTATGLKWAAPAGGGKVLQVVQATYGTITTVTSTTWTDSGLSGTITPSSASSKILVMVNQWCEVDRDGAYVQGGMRLLRGSTFIWGSEQASAPSSYTLETNNQTKVSFSQIWSFIYLDSPATTSATTYKTQIALADTSNNAFIRTQRQSNDSSIILLEIGA